MNLDAPQPISSKSVEEPDHCTMYMNRISKLVELFVQTLCVREAVQNVLADFVR